MAFHLPAHHRIRFQRLVYRNGNNLLGVASRVEILPGFIDNTADGTAYQTPLGLEKFDGLSDFEMVALLNPGQLPLCIIRADETDEFMSLRIA